MAPGKSGPHEMARGSSSLLSSHGRVIGPHQTDRGAISNHFLSLCFRDKNLEYLAWSHSLPILVWGSATTWLPNSSLDGNNFQVSKDFLTAQLQGLCLAFSHHHHLCSTLRGQPVSGLTLSPYNVTFPVPSLDSVSPQVFL